jgi:hypothetical protein
MKNSKLKILVLALMLSALPIFAQLTVSVTPGYRFNSGENVTLSKLNQLGAPAVSVAGTVTGSSLAAGGVSSVHINTNALDQATLLGGYDGSADTDLRVNYDTNTMAFNAGGLGVRTNSLTSAQIASQGVAADELATNSVNAYHLAGGFQFALTNLPAGVTNKMLYADTNGNWQMLSVGTGLEITNNTLQVQQGYLRYSATNASTLAGGVMTFAHGLGVVPGRVRTVMLCVTADAPFVVGSELDIDTVWASGGGDERWAEWADATNVNVALHGTDLRVITGSGATINPTASRWKVKVYAEQ